MQALTRWLQRHSTWIESQQASILSAALIIFVANVTSAIAGLVKNRVLAAVYINPSYPGGLLDAYWVAFRAPEFAYQLIILGSLSAAFVPLFAQRFQKNKTAAFSFAYQTMYILLGLLTLASLFILLFTESFVGLITGAEFSPEQFALAVQMTRIMMIAQLLFGISGFFSAMLQSAKRFIIPAFCPVFYNLGIILVTLFGSSSLGLMAAAWGTVLGAFLHMSIQIPLLVKLGFRWPAWPRWKRAELKEFFQLLGPRTVALTLDQGTLWVITFLATGVGGLALTMMTFAQQLMTLPIRFFGVSISQAALPFLAAEYHDIEGFRRTVFRSLRQITFFTAPAATLLLVLRVPLVRLAYGTDGFPWRATLTTAEAVGILAVSIPAQAATHLLSRAFYARNNTIYPLISSSIYLFTTGLLGWWFGLEQEWGLRGLAIALSVATYLEMILLFAGLLWHIRPGGIRQLLFALARIGLAAFLMAMTLFVFQRLLDLYVFETSRTWQLIQLTVIVTTLGSAVYLGLCWLFSIEEITILQQIWQRVLRQRKQLSRSTPEFVESVSASTDYSA